MRTVKFTLDELHGLLTATQYCFDRTQDEKWSELNNRIYEMIYGTEENKAPV